MDQKMSEKHLSQLSKVIYINLILFKNEHFVQICNFCLKNRNFVQKSIIFSKIDILCKNLKFYSKNLKFWSKNQKFWSKIKNFVQKSTILFKNLQFCSKIYNFVQKIIFQLLEDFSSIFTKGAA